MSDTVDFWNPSVDTIAFHTAMIKWLDTRLPEERNQYDLVLIESILKDMGYVQGDHESLLHAFLSDPRHVYSACVALMTFIIANPQDEWAGKLCAAAAERQQS